MRPMVHPERSDAVAVLKKNRTRDGSDGGAPHLGRLARRAALALIWERLWPRLIVLGGLAGLFLTISWLGIWLDLPAPLRMVGIGLFGLALLAALVWLALTPRPTRAEVLRRLDRDAGTPHRVATSLSDALANDRNDPATLALWNLHRRRLETAVRRLKVEAPAPRMVLHDRFAVRAAVLFAVVGAAFVAGPEKYARVAAAFDWRSDAAAVRSYRLDAWIDPPPYTGRPPSILPVKPQLADAGPSAASSPIRVQAPVGSAVVVRMSAGLDVIPVASGKLVPPASPKPARAPMPNPGTGGDTATGVEHEFRWILKGDATLVFKRGDSALAAFELAAIADQPPTIAITDVPVGNARGSLTVAYRTKDDYGVVGAAALFSKPLRRGGVPGRSLVPPPKGSLTLPPGPNGIGDGRTTIDLSDHSWAGSTVTMTLTARDEGGNVGESAPVQVTLPQRPFLKPLARALVEQRRDLVLAPDERDHVAASLDALMIGPEEFTPEASIYLGLRSALARLNNAKTDADLRSVADLLWEMALRIEDGNLSDAERQLRAAEQQLREAMQRGASDAEIKKLTEDLRAALDRFLNEMAQNADKQPKSADKNGRPQRTITPNDLKKMLDRMADAARNGNMADAQQMLDQMQNVLENLKTARGRGENNDPMAREMSKSLNELDQMTRDQQELRDKTFRQGQKRRDADRGRRGSQSQPAPNGQQDGDEQADGSDGGDKGQERGGQERGQGGAQPPDKNLQDRQDGLRKQLGELKKRLKENGVEGEKGLEEAEQAMKDAGKMLSEGRDGKAVDAQGRALDGLRRGAQGLAQKLEQGGGAGQADGEGNGSANGNQRGRAGRDPLDRPSQNDRDAFRGGMLNGGPGAAQRAQQVLQELRRRLSDPQRPTTELDYLERLLRRY